MVRVAMGLAFALVLTRAAHAQTTPEPTSPGDATQQIMPSSVFEPSATQGVARSADPFASGPIEQPFGAMGAMDAMPRIVLFDRADFTGRRVGLTEDESDLHDHDFTAVASSARIHGGTWQLCDVANFAGHCETLSADTNLDAMGFGDKVVSVRLVDR